MPPSSPDISVVVFCWDLSHRLNGCFRSVERACRHARSAGYRVEVTALRPASADATAAWLGEYTPDGWRLVAYRQDALSAVRKAGLAEAHGRHVAFIDGDTMWAEDWLTAAATAADAAGRPAVWRPELTVLYGDFFFLVKGYGYRTHPDSAGLPDPAALLFANPYGTSFLAPGDVLEAVPFPAEVPAEGWGDTDWWWTCNCIGTGVHHRVVEGGLHYQYNGLYRQSPPRSDTGPARIGPSPLAHAVA